ncbi:hypothetical protein BDN72DRAFT_427817 [Pluteus cervinus]|uniref:Uncharacterized protein n=1 Tax=Pluteus cervinus TaxID=181527 RepID=A0ACD3B0P7_9AGAR|nr:hypothetical protein BDN72DRAFT_427817 [Pluteus cervinus]
MVGKESKVDVLIVGAGPAGLMACNALLKAGVSVRIVDRRAAKVAAGQADGIQPRTIEVLQSYGLADRLLREANQMHMAAFYNPGPDGGIELTERVPDVTAPTARYPFEATLHQGAVESIFIDSMATMGLQVERPVIPTSIQLSEDERILKDPQSYPVRVTLKHLGTNEETLETEIVNAKFLLGSDGAHSWVRKSFGIEMEGEQTDDVWGVVDIVPDTDFPDIRNRCVVHSNNGSCMIIPREGDKARIYVQLNDKSAVDSESGRVDKGRIGPEQLLEVARKSFHPYTFSAATEISWWTIYIVGQRVASRFSVHERVFIAGDACHTHSPKAGQGMNASMNDGHNLAWKLAQVIRGWADMTLLETYELERRKYARDLIEFDKKFAKLFTGKPRTEKNQDGVSHDAFIGIFQKFGGFTSGIGIHYQPSLIVNTTHQSLAKGLAIGQRMIPHTVIRAADSRPYDIQDLLPADSRFKILLFTGDASQSNQLAQVQALSEELDRPSSFLHRYTPSGNPFSTFDMLSICATKKEDFDLNNLPRLLRYHWSKVLLDDTNTDLNSKQESKVAHDFGISPAGAIVVVRPDGYIGTIAPLSRQGIEHLDEYFASFMKL